MSSLKSRTDSPQYLTLKEKSEELHKIIACNPMLVARKFQARDLVDMNTVDSVVKDVEAAKDSAIVVNRLMTGVNLKIEFDPTVFYILVDVLKDCADQLPVNVGLLLEQHCGKHNTAAYIYLIIIGKPAAYMGHSILICNNSVLFFLHTAENNYGENRNKCSKLITLFVAMVHVCLHHLQHYYSEQKRS